MAEQQFEDMEAFLRVAKVTHRPCDTDSLSEIRVLNYGRRVCGKLISGNHDVQYTLVKFTDMNLEMKEEAMDICITAVEKYPNDAEKCTQVCRETVVNCMRGGVSASAWG